MRSRVSLSPHHDELHADRRQRAQVLLIGAPGDERDDDERALRAEGFDVVVADSGMSALPSAKLTALDAVVIDDRLADMDAIVLCRQLKAEATGLLPVLHLSTGIAAGEMRARGSEAGADGFLTRPYDSTTLRAAVSTLVRIKREDVERQSQAAATSLLQQALDSLPNHLAMLSATGEIMAVNRAWEAFALSNGYRDSTTGFGANYLDVCARARGEGSEDARATANGIRAVIAGTQDEFKLDYACHSPTEQRWFTVTVQRTARAGSVAAIVTHTDSTSEHEQVVVTEDLRRIQGQLREQFAKMPVATSLWLARGEDFALLDFNEAAEREIPVYSPLVLGKLHSDIFPLGHTEREYLRRALREDVVLHVAVEKDLGPSRGSRSFDLTIGPQQPDRVLLHAIDTTARIALETELRQAHKLDALGRLAGGIAHDFNNLLGVMMGYTGFLLEDLAPGDAAAADLGEVQHAIERAAALTSQLLAFGREQPLQPKLVDLRTVLNKSERLLTRVIGEDIAFTLNLDGSRPLLVMVDVVQLEQVVINLAVNARDAMPTGGSLFIGADHVSINYVEAARHGVASGTYVRLSVRDTGVGIDARTKLRMFDPFFSTKELGKGTGLGLATVYGIVIQSNGFIEVDSAPGMGARINILLPEAPGEASHGTPAYGMATVRRAERAAVVLLVEDEDSLRHVTERLLRKHGYGVIAAANPDEALNLIVGTGAAFDCLVTDVVMPGMSGQELAARIRELRGPVPVLMLSGYARDAIDRRGLVDSDIPLLHKPVKPVELMRAIDMLLRPAGGKTDTTL